MPYRNIKIGHAAGRAAAAHSFIDADAVVAAFLNRLGVQQIRDGDVQCCVLHVIGSLEPGRFSLRYVPEEKQKDVQNTIHTAAIKSLLLRPTLDKALPHFLSALLAEERTMLTPMATLICDDM